MRIDPNHRRVVITGMGVISPNGKDLKTFWGSVRDGKSAAAAVTRFDATKLPTTIAAEVKDFDVSQFVQSRKPGRFDLSIQYGLAAATMALADSGVDVHRLDPDRVCVAEGTTVSGMESMDKVRATYIANSGDFRSLHPYNLIASYCGEGSSTISLHLGIRGHAVTICSGCASSTDAIGYAMRAIQLDEVDVAVAGGAEGMINMLHIGFCRMRVMTEHGGDPKASMRPFDRERDGFVLGEGAAFFVLEELSHALARGARIYAEVVGHGRSSEAYHATDPHPDGWGYVRCLEKAFRQAQMHPSEVQYVNAHGSATPANDPIETKAIKTVFKDHARRLAISASKPIFGHLMGAAGAIEAMVCLLALWHKEIPPTINLTDPDPACDLDYVPSEARGYPIRAAVKLSAGFGGRYAALIFRSL